MQQLKELFSVKTFKDAIRAVLPLKKQEEAPPTPSPKAVFNDEEQAKRTAEKLGLKVYDDLSTFQIDRALTKRVPILRKKALCAGCKRG